MNDESAQLLIDCLSGSDEAARTIIDRYTSRLIGLARSRLTSKLNRRVDPEDIVQSAYRSFFRRAEEGEFTLNRSGDLWRLLAGITLCKTLKRVEREAAQKRDFRREMSSGLAGSDSPHHPLKAFDTEPTPEHATLLIEELSAMMDGLSERDRQIVERRLQEESFEEIASAVNISESTVRRVLRMAKEELERRLS